MNDGLIGRNRKLTKLVETLELEGWDWLAKMNGAIQTGDDDTVSHRMSEVITGRPVLSMNKKLVDLDYVTDDVLIPDSLR